MAWGCTVDSHAPACYATRDNGETAEPTIITTMKNKAYLPTIVLSTALLFGATALANEGDEQHRKAPDKTAAAAAPGELVKATEKDAEWLKKAKAEYPLTTCPVSGDALDEGDMKPLEYIYRQPDKPDRLVIFCCKGCIKDFKKNPDKFLKKIDEAAAKKAKPAPESPKK